MDTSFYQSSPSEHFFNEMDSQLMEILQSPPSVRHAIFSKTIDVIKPNLECKLLK